MNLNEDEVRLVERALNVLFMDLNAEEREACNHILARILDDRGCGGASYTLSFEAPIEWSPAAISAAIQTECFWDGSVLAGYYKEESIRLREDGRWEFELLRPDCEADWHNCYAGSEGHDGSDEQATKQVEGELGEALTNAALIKDVRVESRKRL